MINLKLFNKEKLKQFIESPEYKTMPTLPISYHRAISHIHNPRALNDDILLIIAYENEQMLGYLGILPDDIYVGNSKFHFGWLSCIWVSPLARGKGIAKKLVLSAYEAYQQHIMITNFTHEAGILYNKLNIFTELPVLSGYRYYRKMCLANILPNRFPKTKLLKPTFSIFDKCFNLLWYPDLFRKSPDFSFIEQLPDEELINKLYPSAGFHRNYREFYWIKTYPWIKKVEQISDEAKKYHFSSEEKQYEFSFLAIEKNEKIVGYLCLSLRNKHLKIPYLFYNEKYKNDVAKSIESLIIQKNPLYITLFLPQEILNLLHFSYLFKKKIHRYFKISQTLFEKIHHLNKDTSIIIYDGDGDAIFT